MPSTPDPTAPDEPSTRQARPNDTPPGPFVQAGSEPGEAEKPDDEAMRRLLHDLDVANDWHPEA